MPPPLWQQRGGRVLLSLLSQSPARVVPVQLPLCAGGAGSAESLWGGTLAGARRPVWSHDADTHGFPPLRTQTGRCKARHWFSLNACELIEMTAS